MATRERNRNGSDFGEHDISASHLMNLIEGLQQRIKLVIFFQREVMEWTSRNDFLFSILILIKLICVCTSASILEYLNVRCASWVHEMQQSHKFFHHRNW